MWLYVCVIFIFFKFRIYVKLMYCLEMPLKNLVLGFYCGAQLETPASFGCQQNIYTEMSRVCVHFLGWADAMVSGLYQLAVAQSFHTCPLLALHYQLHGLVAVQWFLWGSAGRPSFLSLFLEPVSKALPFGGTHNCCLRLGASMTCVVSSISLIYYLAYQWWLIYFLHLFFPSVMLVIEHSICRVSY